MRCYSYILALCCSLLFLRSSAQIMIYKTSESCNGDYLEMIEILEKAQEIVLKDAPKEYAQLNAEEVIAILYFATGQKALPSNHIFFEREGYNQTPGIYEDPVTGESISVTKKDKYTIEVPDDCYKWYSVRIAKDYTYRAASNLGKFYTEHKEPQKALPYLKLARDKYFIREGCVNGIISYQSEMALLEMLCYEQLSKIDVAIDTVIKFGFYPMYHDSRHLIDEFVNMLERQNIRSEFKTEVQKAIDNAELVIDDNSKKKYYVKIRGRTILAAVNPTEYVNTKSNDPLEIIKEHSIYSRL